MYERRAERTCFYLIAHIYSLGLTVAWLICSLGEAQCGGSTVNRQRTVSAASGSQVQSPLYILFSKVSLVIMQLSWELV